MHVDFLHSESILPASDLTKKMYPSEYCGHLHYTTSGQNSTSTYLLWTINKLPPDRGLLGRNLLIPDFTKLPVS